MGSAYGYFQGVDGSRLSSGFLALLQSFMFALFQLLAQAALLLWLGGGKGDNAGVMRRVGGVIIALGVIGLAVSGAGVELGTWIASLFSG